MGGAPKGLIRVESGETLVDRWVRLLAELGVDAVLVGARSEYAPRPMLADAVAGIGPLGGLLALLEQGLQLAAPGVDPVWALALGCDMPHVSPALVKRLLGAPPDAVAVAPRREGRWEPMFARYDARRALPAVTERASRGEGSMQGLLDELGATELPLDADEARELDDWDTAEDVARRPA